MIQINMSKKIEPDCEDCIYNKKAYTPTDRGDIVSYECTIDYLKECPDVENYLDSIDVPIDIDDIDFI